MEDRSNIIKEAIEYRKQLEKENTELKAENERLKEKILKFRWDNPYFDLYNNVVNQRDMWEQKSKQYRQTLQKIKARIPEDYKIYQWYDDVMQLITKAESEG